MLSRRIVAVLVVGILLIAAAASAVILLGPPRVPLSESTSDADQVTLYQNGLAFIQLTRAFESNGGESLLALTLPTTARLDSLTIEGEDVTVKQVRSSLSEVGSLQPGDEVVVHAGEERTYAGTFLGEKEGSAILATATGTTLVDLSQVVAIEIDGRELAPDADPGAAEATVLVEAPAGAHEVRVSYLAHGAPWTPSYHLDVGTGALSFFATFTGLADWRNVTLDLVAGSPNVVLTPQPPTPQPVMYRAQVAEEGAEVAQASLDDRVAPSVPLGELHRYRYQEPVSVSRGESVRLPVEQGEIEVVRHYLEVRAHVDSFHPLGAEQPLPVSERFELRNTLGEPLPPGAVSAYRDGTWIGSDMLEATPRDARTNLTLASSENVQARLVTESHETSGVVDTTTHAVHVENFKDEAADVRVVVEHATHRTERIGTEPEPSETQGGLVAWDATLEPGEEASFRVTLERTHER